MLGLPIVHFSSNLNTKYLITTLIYLYFIFALNINNNHVGNMYFLCFKNMYGTCHIGDGLKIRSVTIYIHPLGDVKSD